MARPTKPVDTSTYAGQVGARIRARREKLKRSVAEASEAAGVPGGTWYHWEKGEHLPLQRLPAIAAALDCKPRDLLPP